MINYCTTEAAFLMFKLLLYFCLTSSLTTVFCYGLREIPELKSGDLISVAWCLRVSCLVVRYGADVTLCQPVGIRGAWCYKCRCEENICTKIEEVAYKKLGLQKHHNLYSSLNI